MLPLQKAHTGSFFHNHCSQPRYNLIPLDLNYVGLGIALNMSAEGTLLDWIPVSRIPVRGGTAEYLKFQVSTRTAKRARLD